MNNNEGKSLDSYRSFLLLSEIAGEEPLSQRELSRRLGIAVGLVNSYLKNLVAKGYVRVKNFPRNRYAYLLTPTGLAEKSRLAYQHLSYFTNLYTVARQDYLALFQSLKAEGVTQVVFCGVDEVAEIAYLSLREAGLELTAVMDDEAAGREFFGRPIVSLREGIAAGNVSIVITSLKRREKLREQLESVGVGGGRVRYGGGGEYGGSVGQH
uniref:Winged helix-turn-helix transcriptional regulator n=1 Tax=Geobacter metallireducens TaxID=28232 RepID=A0A831XFY9_GEOME